MHETDSFNAGLPARKVAVYFLCLLNQAERDLRRRKEVVLGTPDYLSHLVDTPQVMFEPIFEQS